MRAPLVTLLSLAVFATNAPLAGATDAESDKKAVGILIRSAIDDLLTVLKNKDLPLEEKRKRVDAIIDPLTDFPLMAKLTLGARHWQAIDEKQQQSFTKLFVTALKAS